MKVWKLGAFAAVAGIATLIVPGQDSGSAKREALWHHRNLGKALYENPTTQLQAVDEFRKALELAPDSAAERVNYALALLRAGKTQEGVAELEKAQKRDPSIPHTWFNLGIVFKKESEYEKAIPQLEQMLKLVPDEPITHYNLGVLYKLTGRQEDALKAFEAAAKLNPNLAGPHFQLYNAYRQLGRAEDSAREEKIFRELKARQAGAAVPEDLEWSFYAEIYDVVEPAEADPTPPAAVKLEARQLGKVQAASAGLAVADVDGDRKPDLIAWSAEGAQIYKDAAAALDCGLGSLKDVVSVTPGDFNDDGLMDLAVITRGGAQLFVNHKGKFEAHNAALPAGAYAKAVWIDYDHDYDLDLFLLGPKPALMRNNGQAGFSNESASFPFAAGNATDGVLFEAVPDTDGKDFIVSYSDKPGILYRDKLGGRYEAQPLGALPAGAGSLSVRDINEDSWTDLAYSANGRPGALINKAGKLEAGPAVDGAGAAIAFADLENRGLGDLIADGKVHRNQGGGQFAAKPEPGLDKAVALAAADFGADGLVDVAMVNGEGAVTLLRNRTETKSGWLQATLTGVKNLKSAYGAEVEVKAGRLYQKQIYRGVPLHFGLRSYKEVETVRITWPNGLIQNEIRQPAGKAAAYKEAPRLSGSCPMIFTWNGKNFEFITDVLGVAPLGASAGDGEYFPVDHDEYVEIAGESLALIDGQYEIRITEELREVAYLDQIRLLAIDHPGTMTVFTNDKFKAPPFPEFRLFGVEKRIYPRSARDHRGNDVRSRLLKRDKTYPDKFRRDMHGVAEKHYLELDFGGAARDNRAVLILNGWVDWADGSTFRAVSQERHGGLSMPALQVKDQAGEWRTVMEDMGIPAGKPKTISVDLTGKFLSESREIRIITDLCVYWDEVFLSEDSAAPDVRMTGMNPASADLQFRGFSKPVIHPERKQPEYFVYDEVLPVRSWNPTPGFYTRYGNVVPLLQEIDDRMVIMGSGDELRLRFDAARLPVLPSGWKRNFLLFVDGWAKDGDANTAYSSSVEPLPFHGMSAYPYPASESFPHGQEYREYLDVYNVRPALRVMRPLVADRRN